MATRLPVFDMLDPSSSPSMKKATEDFRLHTAALRKQRDVGAIISNDDIPTSPGSLDITIES